MPIDPPIKRKKVSLDDALKDAFPLPPIAAADNTRTRKGTPQRGNIDLRSVQQVVDDPTGNTGNGNTPRTPIDEFALRYEGDRENRRPPIRPDDSVDVMFKDVEADGGSEWTERMTQEEADLMDPAKTPNAKFYSHPSVQGDEDVARARAEANRLAIEKDIGEYTAVLNSTTDPEARRAAQRRMLEKNMARILANPDRVGAPELERQRLSDKRKPSRSGFDQALGDNARGMMERITRKK